MLTQLKIRNYAIIKEVTISFDQHLNIVTGETGAGKSILMGALSLILGERADSKILLDNQEKCVIEGHFKITGYDLDFFFEHYELDHEPTCIIRREITTSGKSRAFINDTPVQLSHLKELGSLLVDIVSQHETLELNDQAFQFSVVDLLAGNAEDNTEYRSNLKKLKQMNSVLSEMIELENKSRTDEDYFRYQLQEIEDAKLTEEEQEELEKKVEILTHAETIQKHSLQVAQEISEGESSLTDALRNCRSALAQASRFHPGLQELINRIDSSVIELKDISSELKHIADSSSSDPRELEHCENRLDSIYSLQKKHRVQSNSELLSLAETLRNKLDKLGNLEKEIAEKTEERKRLLEKLEKWAQKISDKRKNVIPDIEKRTRELLAKVHLPNAQFHIELKSNGEQDLHAFGKDSLQFLFSANKGTGLQPIKKVASGGELSRVMLCIKSLLSDSKSLPTLIFDEIDTGISGEAAIRVSEVMKKLAKKHQVIAITHLPQIAGKADTHFFVYKTSTEKETVTHIKTLNEKERVEEIARMLHGENPSAKILEAARELIQS